MLEQDAGPMLFNSFEFLVFFPVVTAAFQVAPSRVRWLLLLLASYVFYGSWSPWYLILLVGTSTFDGFVGLRMEDAPSLRVKRAWLAASLAGNLGLLFVFKYWAFAQDSVATVAAWIGGVDAPPSTVPWVLPVGISFYTFQSLSYTLDVYRGHIRAERKLGVFLLYVAYFPQLVAGPIERAGKLLPQLHAPKPWDWDRTASGLRLAGWGMFKKVVVADRLAAVVNEVYADPTSFGTAAHVLATVFFSYQVYCDFSGYSDIARGTARILGVDLMRNFDQPYLARSMSELWTRWHLSMTTWFRDYVYLPLGGSRVSQARWARNVFVVFVLSGLWHGAMWHMAAWGFAHGVLIVVERFTDRPRAALWRVTGLARAPRLLAVVQWACTSVIWLGTVVLFRAETLSDAVHMLTGLFSIEPFGFVDAQRLLRRLHLDFGLLFYCFALMPIVEVVEYGFRDEAWKARVAGWVLPVRWSLDLLLLFSILLLGSFDDTPFIYFQF